MGVFAKLVQSLDALKEAFVLFFVIGNNERAYPAHAGQLSKSGTRCLELCMTAVLCMVQSGDKSVDEVVAYFSTVEKQICCRRYRKLLAMVCAQHGDEPFYNELSPYWNEVELPELIESFFTAFVQKYMVPHYSGMLGVESPAMRIPQGACAISYYDLSNITIVFENDASRAAFEADGNVAEPCDRMVMRSHGWQS